MKVQEVQAYCHIQSQLLCEPKGTTNKTQKIKWRHNAHISIKLNYTEIRQKIKIDRRKRMQMPSISLFPGLQVGYGRHQSFDSKHSSSQDLHIPCTIDNAMYTKTSGTVTQKVK
jgi:hypothetical protein